MNKSSNRYRTQATNTSTTTIYANVAYDLLTYNMASATLIIESNSNWCHCYLIRNRRAVAALKVEQVSPRVGWHFLSETRKSISGSEMVLQKRCRRCYVVVLKGADLLLKVGDTELKVQVEGATIKAPKLSRLGGKRCKLRNHPLQRNSMHIGVKMA